MVFYYGNLNGLRPLIRMAKIQNTDNRTPSVDRNVEQQELSFIVGENAKWYSSLEDNLAFSYKTKHTLNIQFSNHAPWYIPKWSEKLCPQKNLHTTVYSSFIRNCQNLEASKISFSPWCIQTMEYYSAKKEMIYQTMKWHGGNLNAYG